MFAGVASTNLTSGLTQTAQQLLIFAVAALIVMIIVIVLMLALSRARGERVRQHGRMPQEALTRLRAALVERVGEASQTQGAHITLRGFWRDQDLSASQKYVVLNDLLERQVFYAAYSTDQLVAYFQRLRWDWLHAPVTVVRLSDQNWQRLASGASAGIVANGDVIFVRDSPGAGVVSRSRNVTQTINQELHPELVRELASALREDARALVSGNPLRERAEALADTLERDAALNRSESVKRTAGDVLEFASSAAGLWAATLSILDAVH